MKCMIILLACVVAIQAYGYLPVPSAGQGGYRSGGGFANTGHGSGYNGAHNSGYQAGGSGSYYNSGHVEDDLHQETSHHHAEDYNVGGQTGFGKGGYTSGAYNGYDRGHSNRGGNYQSGHQSGIRG